MTRATTRAYPLPCLEPAGVCEACIAESKVPANGRGLLSSVCDRRQVASLRPICLSPDQLLRRLCHFLALYERWAKGSYREFSLSYLLSQRNHFRHSLEELFSRKATLVSWLLHTHSTALKSQVQSRGAAYFGRNRGIPRFSPRRWL